MANHRAMRSVLFGVSRSLMPLRISRLQRAPEINGSAKYNPSQADVYAAVRAFYALFGAPGSHAIFRFTMSSICSRGGGSTEVIAVQTIKRFVTSDFSHFILFPDPSGSCCSTSSASGNGAGLPLHLG